jgi:undecaprenyl diphosphate synthase
MRRLSPDGIEEMSAVESIVNSVPQHVAFVMDGNGRWASRQGLPRLVGHQAGIAHVEEVAQVVAARRVRYMTLYMFSTENWKRSREEVDGIFGLLVDWLADTGPRLRGSGIGLRHLGRREPLPPNLLDALDGVCGERPDDRLTLCMAINYGARTEIVDAVRAALLAERNGCAIDESAIGNALYTAGLPDPDLLVRPGGELRLSNYLLWQAAYAELYFSPVLWPDFGEEEIDEALRAYTQRRRRFGGL